MSIGPFQSLPGSHEMSAAHALPSEPWLLPIPDSPASSTDESADLHSAVRKAGRPFWIAANALCAALGLMITMQCATGWMSPGSSQVGPVAAMSGPPTIGAQKASLVAHAE